MSATVKHTCVLCNAELESKEELQNHFRKHANKQIDLRGRPIKDKSSGNVQHSQAKPASSSKPVNCDMCDAVFDTVTMAIQHKFRKHPDNPRKHFCPHCGMQFPLKINCDRHMEQHSSEPPAKLCPCSDCGVVFFNSEALNYHSKSTHKRIVALYRPVPTPPPSRKIRTNNAGEAQSVYYCHLCGFEYIVKFNLQKHLERHHPQSEQDMLPVELIKCTTCDALFYTKRAYENHNMYHKPDDLYVTSEEQRLQTITRVDQDFDIRRVQTVADKYIPICRPRRRPQKRIQATQKNVKKSNKEDQSESDSELSPTSEPSSSSDSETEVPRKRSMCI